MSEEKPTVVKNMSKEVFDEFFCEEMFKKIKGKHKQILKLQSEIAGLITEYIDLVEQKRSKRRKK